MDKVTFDTIHGVSVHDTANATLTDVTVKTYNRDTQLVSVDKDASVTVESANIQPGTGSRAAINNAGTLTVNKLTVADGISLNVSNSGGSAFSDVAANAYYANAVAWAEQNEITGGIGGGLFGSGNDCTRAQIVTFLHRSSQAK